MKDDNDESVHSEATVLMGPDGNPIEEPEEDGQDEAQDPLSDQATFLLNPEAPSPDEPKRPARAAHEPARLDEELAIQTLVTAKKKTTGKPSGPPRAAGLRQPTEETTPLGTKLLLLLIALVAVAVVGLVGVKVLGGESTEEPASAKPAQPTADGKPAPASTDDARKAEPAARDGEAAPGAATEAKGAGPAGAAGAAKPEPAPAPKPDGAPTGR